MPKDTNALEDERSSIRCRYCGQRNQVRATNGQARCGRCRLALSDKPHKKFAALDKDQYIHPADKKALAALRAIPGIDSALKKLLAVTGESAIRVIFTASAVKVTPQQCPDLHAKLQIACTTLGVDMPDLFVQQNPVVNAFTGGVEHPVIVLYSSLLERLTDEEVLAVVAHEVGHIHSEHVLYLTAARLIEFLANAAWSFRHWRQSSSNCFRRQCVGRCWPGPDARSSLVIARRCWSRKTPTFSVTQ